MGKALDDLRKKAKLIGIDVDALIEEIAREVEKKLEAKGRLK